MGPREASASQGEKRQFVSHLLPHEAGDKKSKCLQRAKSDSSLERCSANFTTSFRFFLFPFPSFEFPSNHEVSVRVGKVKEFTEMHS